MAQINTSTNCLGKRTNADEKEEEASKKYSKRCHDWGFLSYAEIAADWTLKFIDFYIALNAKGGHKNKVKITQLKSG